MRTQQEIITEIDRTQQVYNRLVMDIGQMYANHRLKNDSQLVPLINEKVEAFQKVELSLRTLEQELSKTEE